MYDPRSEYLRMGVKPGGKWRISHFNMDYLHVDSYPPIVIVPGSVPDSKLMYLSLSSPSSPFVRSDVPSSIMKDRTRQRIPVLSWLSADGVALCRSSQPCVGLSNRTLREDVEYLKIIGGRAAVLVVLCVGGCCVVVVDLASYQSRLDEQVIDYCGCSSKSQRTGQSSVGRRFRTHGQHLLLFLLQLVFHECWYSFSPPLSSPSSPTENIHVVRESRDRLLSSIITRARERIQSPMHIPKKIESEQWLDHVRSIIFASQAIVRWIHHRKETGTAANVVE